MPAKIRNIQGVVALGNYIDPWLNKSTSDYSPDYSQKSVAVFEFNKSLDYEGGTLGKFKTSLRKDRIRYRIKQDLNNDGNFSKDELIYAGEVKGVDDAESLLNFEGKIKIKKQMHDCDWDIQKNPENLVCTADYVQELIDSRFIHKDGDVFDFPVYSPIGLLGGELF